MGLLGKAMVERTWRKGEFWDLYFLAIWNSSENIPS